LTQAEVDAFLKLCYKIMAHHCFLGKSTKEVLKEKEENATASNANQDATTAPLTPDQEATLLYDTIKLRCTECPVIHSCMLGLINMSISVPRRRTQEHNMPSRRV